MLLLHYLPWGAVEKPWLHSDWRLGAARQQEAPLRGDFKEKGVVMKHRKTGGLHHSDFTHMGYRREIVLQGHWRSLSSQGRVLNL